MREHVIAFVREINAGGTAIVWATPGGEEVSLARRVMGLDQGNLVEPAVVGESPGARAVPPWPNETAPAARAVLRLRFDTVSFAYDGHTILRDLNLEAGAGECVRIAGANGSGKSTLLLLAGGALHPATGRITRRTGEHGVLYLPQSPERLFFAETVREEICFGLERRGVTRTVAQQKASDAMARAGLDPAAFALRSPFELSFGEMRRVAFAIAFALEPELLLLDEPAACLDESGREILERLTRHSAALGAAVLVASHEEPRAAEMERTFRIAQPHA